MLEEMVFGKSKYFFCSFFVLIMHFLVEEITLILLSFLDVLFLDSNNVDMNKNDYVW